MSAQAVGFSADGAKRVARATKAVERSLLNASGGGDSAGDFPLSFWARITGRTAGEYSWRRMTPRDSDGLLQDDPQNTTGTLNAEEVYGLNGVPIGSRVVMIFVGYKDVSGVPTPRYRFQYVMPGQFFAVKVTQTGGAAGDATTACTFTYTVEDLNNVSLGTSMSPELRRTATGKYSAPSARSIGQAYYDGSAVLHLYDANEVPFVESC